MRQTCRSPSRTERLATLCAVTLCGLALQTRTVSAEAPPAAAQPGQCFGRVRLPDEVVIEHQRSRVQVPGRLRRFTPAQFRVERTRVLVAPARTVRVVIPARYRTIARVVTVPGSLHVVNVPAKFALQSTRMQVTPARLVWVRRAAALPLGDVLPGQTGLTPTGEILCRVRMAARYLTRTRRVLVTRARRVEMRGPPRREETLERVLVAPAREELRPRPAVYRTQRRSIMVRPASETWVATPRVWRTIAHERRVAHAGWAQVVCPGGLAPWAMQRLQSALVAQGYDAGPDDGQPRPQTFEALRRFQAAHGLGEGQITVESARALGVLP